MRYFRTALLALVLSPFTASCDAMTATDAERCVLVDLHARAGKELYPILDSFAKNHGLIPDKSHPINPRYARKDENEVIAEVSYTIGMGEFGAELTLFRFDNERNEDLLEAFDTLVEEEIRPKYGVRTCEEVEGYELPIVYR